MKNISLVTPRAQLNGAFAEFTSTVRKVVAETAQLDPQKIVRSQEPYNRLANELAYSWRVFRARSEIDRASQNIDEIEHVLIEQQRRIRGEVEAIRQHWKNSRLPVADSTLAQFFADVPEDPTIVTARTTPLIGAYLAQAAELTNLKETMRRIDDEFTSIRNTGDEILSEIHTIVPIEIAEMRTIPSLQNEMDRVLHADSIVPRLAHWIRSEWTEGTFAMETFRATSDVYEGFDGSVDAETLERWLVEVSDYRRLERDEILPPPEFVGGRDSYK